MTTDVAIPLAYAGRALDLEFEFGEALWDLSREHTAEFLVLITHRYVANLFSPRWGILFGEEDAND
jgi:hypothetical protein